MGKPNKDDFEIEDGILKRFNGDGEEVVIPEGVITVQEAAFIECPKLKSIVFPNTLKHDDMLSVKNCINDLLLIAELCRKEHPNERKYLFTTSFGRYIALLCSKKLKDFSIVLRASAVTMPEHILTDLLDTTPESFEKSRTITCGFDRKICLQFSFYEELQMHKISHYICDNPMLIIHGDMDDIVPYRDIVDFCSCHKNAVLRTVYGADHRFKKTGEVEQVIESAISYWKI